MKAALALSCALSCALASTASAQGASEQALQQAQKHASIDELEALGARRPVTPWTDDAWRAAALLAERGRDFERAIRALEQVIATTSDETIRRRALGDLERLRGRVGEGGQWAGVASRIDARIDEIRAVRGDPEPALRALEDELRASPGYPGAVSAMLALAAGWEREGERERSLGWLREAVRDDSRIPADRTRARAELVRALTRLERLDDARRELASLSDRLLVKELETRIDRARSRGWWRRGAAGVLVLVMVAAMFALRRRAASWREAVAGLRRPPWEALFYVPVAALLAIVSQSGNPLVAHAVVGVGGAGLAVAWISGALLAGRRTRLGYLCLHCAMAVLAVASATYLILDQQKMLDLVAETWRGGPALR